MNNPKRTIYKVLSYLFIAISILTLALLVEKIPVFPGVIFLIASALLSILFWVFAKMSEKGKKGKPAKLDLTKEENARLKENDKKLDNFASMSFEGKFKVFLELLGVDFTKYGSENFETKDGKSLTLSDVNSANINDFDWAEFLAAKHELILINSSQDTLDSLSEFESYKDGFIPNYLKQNTSLKVLSYYRKDIRHNDAERFRLAKDMKYFIRDVCGNISNSGSKLIPIYIETNDPNTFLFGIYDSIVRQGLDYDSTKRLRLLAESIGLYVFPVSFAFPQTLRKPLSCDDCYGDGVLIDKNYVSDCRNNGIIKEITDKKKAARAKQLEKYLSAPKPIIENNDNFVPLSHGFKSDDEVECFIFGKKHKLRVSSVNKDEGELLDDDEIAEVNWLIKSNVMDDIELQFEVLDEINERYNQWCDNFSHKTNIEKEFNITSIMIDIQSSDTANLGETAKIIAFCGDAECDVEHGLSVSFLNRKFVGVNSFYEFNYIQTEKTL